MPTRTTYLTPPQTPATRTTWPYIREQVPQAQLPPGAVTYPAGQAPAAGDIVPGGPGVQQLLNPLALLPIVGGAIGLLSGGDPYSVEEASLDYFGLGYFDREGNVSQTRTTPGTGLMAAGTFRAWDPVQQGYYGILKAQGQAFQGMTFAPGNQIPDGDVITKAWVGHSVRKDDSLATTQFAMTADGWSHSLSESGVMKHWKPYKSIVIGKSLTTGNLKKVARRVKSHTKSLKKILSVFK